ncbi:MAG: acyltransferase [Pseudobutyrivibrio ruminis]|uniref:Acyltransferase n=1 Tax=Pseudobutyrivibrio ruminis TaxID=46206 RepID=A0A927U8H6_9FIRM|nr:acyltransferase [Pseudobutyrivibrio ruminis]
MKNEINKKAISGMKFLAIIGMIFYHSGFNKIPGYGAFACMFFFMISGFTTGYYRINNWDLSSDSILNYYSKKIKSISWIYYFTFIIMIPYTMKEIDSIEQVKEAICNGMMHLLFIQCWFPDIHYKFNAVAWFSSAILFCYLLTPVLVSFARKVNKVSKAFVIVGLCILLHFFLEYCSIQYPDVFGYSMHTNPFIRCLEYYMGMILSVIYSSISNKRNSFALYSVFEGISLFLVLGSTYLFLSLGYKSIVLVPMLILVYVYSLGYGVLSKILSCDLFKISFLQSEIYLLHYPVIEYSGFVLRRINIGLLKIKGVEALCYVIFTIIAAYIVHSCWGRICKRKAAN